MQSVVSSLPQLRRRLLHWVFRISDLKPTLALLEAKLGLKVQRHEEFELKCDATCNGDFENPWSKTMVARGDEKSFFALELVYNYGVAHYEPNPSHFQNLEFLDLAAAPADYEKFELDSYTFVRFGPGYFENYVKAAEGFPLKLPTHSDFKFVTLNVASLENALDYYTNVLHFQVFGLYNADEAEGYSAEFKDRNPHNFAIIGLSLD